MTPHTSHRAVLIGLTVPLAGCAGVQSALGPEGRAAQESATLFWIMATGGGVILLAVLLLTFAALFLSGDWRSWMANDHVIIGGGILFPVVTLSGLLGLGLLVTGSNSISPTAREIVRIAVVGEQWWWRIGYRTPDGRRFEAANEIRIPVGMPTAIELTTADVIHSFWVPKLAGKLDMIPGRTTLLHLEATRPGVSRGQCAEYCGGAHAWMAFHVVAMEPQAYESWLMHESSPAIAPKDLSAVEGQKLFLASGCGGCHTVRGTPAMGTIGPDLTHVGSRLSLAAATLPNDAPAFARWIKDNQHVKPENRMPPFTIFTEAELAALSSYLTGLK